LRRRKRASLDAGAANAPGSSIIVASHTIAIVSSLAAVAALAACAALVAFASRARALARTPALDCAGRRGGIGGFYTDTGGYRIFCRTHAGPADAARQRLPVMLVHGLVISSRYMAPLARVLGRDFEVYAPDLPGFGESTITAGNRAQRARALSIDELADALHAWLVACGIARAAFVGNSFGCQVIAAFAARFPSACACVVLQGITPDPRARHLPLLAWRDFVNGRREGPRSPAAPARVDYAKAGLARAFATMRMLVRDRIEYRLPQVSAPALVVAGSRDPVAPPDWSADAARRLRDGRLLVIPGGTHTLNYAYPHAFAHAIRPFLLAHTSRRADERAPSAPAARATTETHP